MMSDQLSFSLNLDASPMVQSATNAARTLETKFKQANNSIRADFQKPLEIQGEFNLTGDPKKTYNDIVKAQNDVVAKQVAINKKVNEMKTAQDRVTTALRGSTEQKKAALSYIEKMQQKTNLTQQEMKKLADMATQLKKNLPKELDMPSPAKTENLTSALTAANSQAKLVTKSIELLAKGLKSAIETGIKMESLNLQMEAFTGSANEAERAMAKFAEIAAKTPLDVMGVASAGKIMMAYGVDVDTASEATEQLAIVSAATGGDINLLARNLGQVSTQGRAYTRDLTQFAIQGIPIWAEMAKVTGKSTVELKEMAREGTIGMQTVSAALRRMTAEGSAFADVADRMQTTYAGKLAKVQSDFQVAAGSIVEDIGRIDESLGASDAIMKVVAGSLGLLAKALGLAGDEAEKSAYTAAVMRESQVNYSDSVLSSTEQTRGFIETVMGITSLTPVMDSAAGTANEIQAEFSGLQSVSSNWGISVTELTKKLRDFIQEGTKMDLVDDFRDLSAQLGVVEQDMGDLYKEMKETTNINKEAIEAQIDKYEDLRDAARDNLADIESYYDSLKAEATADYNDIKIAADSVVANSNAIIESLQKQIGQYGELGPAGKK